MPVVWMQPAPGRGYTRLETRIVDTRLNLLAPRMDEFSSSPEEMVSGERPKGWPFRIPFVNVAPPGPPIALVTIF